MSIAKAQRIDFRWDDLSVIHAVFVEGSLAGAARELGVRTSTVSRRVEALEAALGAQIFQRTREGVLPTEAAHVLMPIAERAIAVAREAAVAVAGLEAEPEGTVVLTAPPGVATYDIAPWLAEFQRRYPKIHIELDARVAYVDLVRREADIAIRAIRPQEGDLISRRLGAVRSVFLASPAYAEELRPVQRLEAVRWVGWSRELREIPTARWHRALVPEEAFVLRSRSIHVIGRAAQAGVGAALLPEAYASVFDLVPLPLSRALSPVVPPWPQDEAHIVCARSMRRVPRVAALWDFIVEHAAEALAPGGLP